MKFKKHFFSFCIALISYLGVSAQNISQVNWKIISPDKVIVGKSAELIYKVNIKPLNYIYSVNTNSKNGKNTAIWFYNNSNSYKVIDKTEAIFEIDFLNKNSNQTEYIIEGEGGFTQKIKILKPNPVIKGKISYILHSKETGREKYLEEEFTIHIRTTN
mgnify:CR=1 FL=1|tara:strand:- start:491 stop:967 length:477 start_codon:yes stop_codon:yes gene_type:complete